MKIENYKYSFNEGVKHVSEGFGGVCYLLDNKLILDINGEIKSVSLRRHRFAEAYVMNAERVLLVKNDCCGSPKELFSFELYILDITKKEIILKDKYKWCDYRGVKVLDQSIYVAYNRYKSSLEDQFDPDGLQYEPPCPELALSAEVVELDFYFKYKDSVIYDEIVPDHLILSFGGVSPVLEVILNDSTWCARDKILWSFDSGKIFLRDLSTIIRRDNSGNEEIIFDSPDLIKGVGMSLRGELPEFKVYLRDRKVFLLVSNSVSFILD